MKDIITYINEGFKLGKNKVKKTIEHKYFPKSKYELKEILKKRLIKDENADLNDIDVSDIVDMAHLFEHLDPHNIDISEWDVSNVVNMNYMFYFCDKFDSDLSYWDVSNVKNMYAMFANCENLNCDLSNWDVSNVENMHNMFFECDSLKKLPSWYKN